MMTAEQLAQFRALVEQAQTICIFFPTNASPDIILSAVSLGRGLAHLGTATVLSPQSVTGQLTQFEGVSQVNTEFGNKNLDVSFPYKQEQVDKVSYHIDEDTQMFHLVIQPQKGQRPLDASAVQFALSGAEADVIITLGVDQLDQLDQLYFSYESVYEAARIMSFHTYDTSFGELKINVADSSSYAEVIHQIVSELGTEDAAVATNLLAGLESATQTFQSLSVTAETFVAAGQLLTAGARRVRVETEVPKVKPGGQGSVAFAEVLDRGKKSAAKK